MNFLENATKERNRNDIKIVATVTRDEKCKKSARKKKGKSNEAIG